MKPTYFVRRKESPDPKHETLEAAQAKAEKMAEGEPGQVFEILKCVGYASTSKASTFWMDGEGPPEKPRYRMLDVGEYCQEGDEAQLDPMGGWTRRQYRGKQLEGMNPTRRPL